MSDFSIKSKCCEFYERLGLHKKGGESGGRDGVKETDIKEEAFYLDAYFWADRYNKISLIEKDLALKFTCIDYALYLPDRIMH
jgi:hypothetical protein